MSQLVIDPRTVVSDFSPATAALENFPGSFGLRVLYNGQVKHIMLDRVGELYSAKMRKIVGAHGLDYSAMLELESLLHRWVKKQLYPSANKMTALRVGGCLYMLSALVIWPELGSGKLLELVDLPRMWPHIHQTMVPKQLHGFQFYMRCLHIITSEVADRAKAHTFIEKARRLENNPCFEIAQIQLLRQLPEPDARLRAERLLRNMLQNSLRWSLPFYWRAAAHSHEETQRSDALLEPLYQGKEKLLGNAVMRSLTLTLARQIVYDNTRSVRPFVDLQDSVFVNLLPECLHMIFDHLPLAAIARLRAVCFKFWRLLGEERYWAHRCRALRPLAGHVCSSSGECRRLMERNSGRKRNAFVGRDLISYREDHIRFCWKYIAKYPQYSKLSGFTDGFGTLYTIPAILVGKMQNGYRLTPVQGKKQYCFKHKQFFDEKVPGAARTHSKCDDRRHTGKLQGKKDRRYTCCGQKGNTKGCFRRAEHEKRGFFKLIVTAIGDITPQEPLSPENLPYGVRDWKRPDLQNYTDFHWERQLMKTRGAYEKTRVVQLKPRKK